MLKYNITSGGQRQKANLTVDREFWTSFRHKRGNFKSMVYISKLQTWWQLIFIRYELFFLFVEESYL